MVDEQRQFFNLVHIVFERTLIRNYQKKFLVSDICHIQLIIYISKFAIVNILVLDSLLGKKEQPVNTF